MQPASPTPAVLRWRAGWTLAKVSPPNSLMYVQLLLKLRQRAARQHPTVWEIQGQLAYLQAVLALHRLVKQATQ